MAQATLSNEFRLTDDLERRLVSEMAREPRGFGIGGFARGIGQRVRAVVRFIDDVAQTMDEARAQVRSQGRYFQ